ncbi:MAG: tyrosine/phenylalanine carboxypeptidase domain-containing protein [Ktedonobacteraceae bacterium]
MLQNQAVATNMTISPLPIHFGAFLRMLRERHGISQAEVLKHLPAWTQSAFSKVEKDVRAPTFDQLASIYEALAQAGVQLTMQDRQHFVLLARRKIETRKTRHQHRTEADWENLRVTLAKVDHLPVPSHQQHPVARPAKQHAIETRHLIGREQWLASMMANLHGPLPKKILILQGPPGIGKTSELHRLTNQFVHSVSWRDVIFCELPSLDQEAIGADIALELVLGNILEAIAPHVSLPTTDLQARVNYVLECLSREDQLRLILLDNAEQLLDDHNNLASVWQSFLAKFVQTNHRTALIIATREWPLSSIEETQLIMSSMLPPLTEDEGSELLRRMGLRDVAAEQLRQVVKAVGGVPLCLHWVAKLAQNPLLLNNWADFDEESDNVMLARLLEDPSLFGGPVARRLHPLLERVMKHLSQDALTALRDLAVSPVPLGGPALRELYSNPAPLQELRDASLLVAYPKRVQLLPMVEATMRARLSTEQICLAKERLIKALSRWLETGIANLHEQGTVFTGLASLLLRRHRLLAAADLILYHGWLTCQTGQILRLAQLVQQVLEARPLPGTSEETEAETECGRILLHYYLASYLGITIDAQERLQAYQRIRSCVAADQVRIDPLMEVYLTDRIMLAMLNANRFEEAQHLLDDCFERLASLLSGDSELHAMLLSKQALLFHRHSGYLQANGQMGQASRLREQVIALYERCLHLLEEAERIVKQGSLRESTLKKKRASILNNLAYQLHLVGRCEEALEMINQCLALKGQGYAERDSMAAAIGEKSQILASLGQFQEALQLDAQAREEIRRLADAGDTLSREEQWIFQVDQGRLCLLLGQVDKAERLLREAESQIHERRIIYKVKARAMINEIDQWRAASGEGPHQLDWRWVGRYRTLCAYDDYWWLAHAGPFTEEEQRQWNQLFPPGDEKTKEQLRGVLLQSRDREVETALQEGREPRLSYPAIEIEQVRQRITGLQILDAEIEREEPNAIVRRLYHGAIEDNLCYLRMIAATYEGEYNQFWEQIQQIYPPPTVEEMQYALTRVAQVLQQGLQREDTQEISQQLLQVLEAWGIVPSDLGATMYQIQETPSVSRPEITSRHQQTVSPQAARRFFEAALRESGYDKWQVVLDQNASGPRVESGLRHLFLPISPLSLEDIREYLSHELLGHIARSVAGEHSPLGLLGMGTKGYSPTEEGLADYYERRVASLHGDPFDDSGAWMGPLAVGLACGIVTPPQTFLSLFRFVEPFLLLYRLLWRNDEERPTAEERARKNARVRCLRTFRGVPDLERPGICFTKDVVYLRGYLQIRQAVAEDETVLDRLAVGKVALEQLPDLQELGIVAPSQIASLRNLAYDPGLDDYILSFEAQENNNHSF